MGRARRGCHDGATCSNREAMSRRYTLQVCRIAKRAIRQLQDQWSAMAMTSAGNVRRVALRGMLEGDIAFAARLVAQ
jgi:hypothetical protein